MLCQTGVLLSGSQGIIASCSWYIIRDTLFLHVNIINVSIISLSFFDQNQVYHYKTVESLNITPSSQNFKSISTESP